MNQSPLSFIHDLTWQNLPRAVQRQAELNLLDLIGVAAGGTQTRLSSIINSHATEEFGGTHPMLFDARTSSIGGAALAAGMTIDSLDGHDGFNPAKGHIGCPLFSAALMMAHDLDTSGQEVSGTAFLETIVMGYEFGARASVAQHGTVPDYHTSGSWGAVTAAAAGARLMKLDAETTRHALGIAEYHGPRSQMMRCIDYPTMLKDGAGWGAMCGVHAVRLAAKGFTGAPAITVEQAPQYWDDLGERWAILSQYYKPYPVCRWAQAPIEGALTLQRTHAIPADQIAKIEIETFHESIRLATKRPLEADAAQYSTSFPVAIALVRGDVTAADVAYDDALFDPEILRLSDATEMRESKRANSVFPHKRIAKVTLTLKNGTRHAGDWIEPRWDPTNPPTESELREKFHKLADPVLGESHAAAIEDALMRLPETGLRPLTDQLLRPINA
jgi:2-methylcitrate dehydratase PrpD